jgi:hypothetical protein
LRRGLIIKIVEAADDVLSYGRALTYPNMKRYVTRDLLTGYTIRKNTKIRDGEWLLATQVLREDRRRRGITGYTDTPRSTRFELLLRGLIKHK